MAKNHRVTRCTLWNILLDGMLVHHRQSFPPPNKYSTPCGERHYKSEVFCLKTLARAQTWTTFWWSKSAFVLAKQTIFIFSYGKPDLQVVFYQMYMYEEKWQWCTKYCCHFNNMTCLTDFLKWQHHVQPQTSEIEYKQDPPAGCWKLVTIKN